MKKRLVDCIEQHKHDEFDWHNKDRVHYRPSIKGVLAGWVFSRYKKDIIPNDEMCKEDFKERMARRKVIKQKHS